MAKKFNIHDWQSKHIFEQNDFVPDLEDDELKRSKVQQMMAKEKERMGGDEKLRSTVEAIADMYSYGEILDALESFYIKNDEQPFAKMAKKHAKEFRDFLDDEDEIDEASMTGAGGAATSVSAGSGPQYATPYAFGNNKRKKKKGYMGYKEVNEQEEEELSKDAQRLQNIIEDIINTKDEWVDMFQILMSHSEEIQGLNDSQIKSLLQQSLKDM